MGSRAWWTPTISTRQGVGCQDIFSLSFWCQKMTGAFFHQLICPLSTPTHQLVFMTMLPPFLALLVFARNLLVTCFKCRDAVARTTGPAIVIIYAVFPVCAATIFNVGQSILTRGVRTHAPTQRHAPRHTPTHPRRPLPIHIRTHTRTQRLSRRNRLMTGACGCFTTLVSRSQTETTMSFHK